MSEGEVAYLAGIVDGDGTIAILKNRVRNSYTYRIIVQVTNTDYRLMEWLKKKAGGIVSNPSTRPKRRECYQWTISGNQAANLLKSIYPFLVSKREQAEIALKFWHEKKDMRRLRPEHRQKEIEWREELIRQLHHANNKPRDANSLNLQKKTQTSERD